VRVFTECPKAAPLKSTRFHELIYCCNVILPLFPRAFSCILVKLPFLWLRAIFSFLFSVTNRRPSVFLWPVLFYVCADVFHVLLLCMFSCFIAWILFVFSDQQAPVFWPFFNLFLFLWLVLFYVCADVLLLCMFSCFIAWILCGLFGPVYLYNCSVLWSFR